MASRHGARFACSSRCTTLVVINELLSAWRGFDYSDDYARTLLSNVEFGEWVFPVRRWEVLCRLRHLTTLRAVKLIGNVHLADRRADQYPLADILELRSLELAANEVVRDLTPLSRCRELYTVKVSMIGGIRDWSGLAGSTVRELVLDISARNRTLAGVAHCAQLHELQISAPVSDAEAGQLRGHPSLRVLRCMQRIGSCCR